MFSQKQQPEDKNGEKKNFESKFFLPVKFWINFSTMRQILNPEFWNVSYLEPTFYNCKFWIKFFFTKYHFLNQLFPTRQILNRILYNASKFQVKLFSDIEFCEQFVFKNHFFVSLHRGSVIVSIFGLSWKTRFWKRYFWKITFESKILKRTSFWITFSTTRQILNRDVWNVSDLVPNFQELNRFHIDILTVCQICSQLFYHPSDFDLKTSKRIKV